MLVATIRIPRDACTWSSTGLPTTAPLGCAFHAFCALLLAAHCWLVAGGSRATSGTAYEESELLHIPFRPLRVCDAGTLAALIGLRWFVAFAGGDVIAPVNGLVGVDPAGAAAGGRADRRRDGRGRHRRAGADARARAGADQDPAWCCSRPLPRYELGVLPLFLLMAHLCFAAGASRDFFDAAASFIGHRRGGLALASIAGCAGFGAISGSSLATAATIGLVGAARDAQARLLRRARHRRARRRRHARAR